MDEGTRQKIEANLFPAARAAITDYGRFPWHRYAWKPNSSQALAIDLFGTLKTASDPEKSLIFDSFAAQLGLPTSGSWDVMPEWRDEENRLHEERRARTQIDAVARNSRCVILFECKFTEEAGSLFSNAGGYERRGRDSSQAV